MTKRRSRFLFILFAIILVVLLCASFVNFTYPLSINGKYYSYSSFVSNLRLGEDVSKSLRIVYRAEGVENANYAELKESTKNQILSIVRGEGYKDATVANYGIDSIVLTVGNILDEDDKNTITDLVGDPRPISFSMKSDGTEPFANQKDISNVSAIDYVDPDSGETTYLVSIQFKSSRKQAIKEATSAGGTMYIYFGEENFTTSGMSISDGGIDGVIYIQSEAFVSKAVANSYANKIRSGMLDLELTATETGMISASNNRLATLLICVALSILLLVGFVYLIVKFRQIGLLACFALLFNLTLGVFFLQSIPLVHLNFAGILAMVIMFVVAIDGILTIYNKAKSIYNKDTALHIAFRESQKSGLMKILISNALFFVAGFMCLFMPSMSIQSFGWVALVMSVINIATNLGLMRLFINMYLPFNSTDGKKCNFHKGGKNA